MTANEPLDHLIEGLREELTQYGEMLALLDQQQEAVMTRSSNEVFRTTSCIDSQAELIAACRRAREGCQRALASILNTTDTSFATLLPLLPSDYRPLVSALVQENNHLLVRAQQRARQNQLILSRSLDLMRHLLGTLSGTGSTLYDGSGGLAPTALSGRCLDAATA